MTVVPVDTTNALAVTDYLTKARDWLATAVEVTGPEQIARAKAEIATAAEATKQLGLSKEIQLDAQEMVRRAEYALAKSIRKGQADGEIAAHGGGRRSTTSTPPLKSPSEFASKQELSGAGHGQPGIYALADADEDDFEVAIDQAKAEGNLSRANVARKARDRRLNPCCNAGPGHMPGCAKANGAPRKSPRRPLIETSRHAGLELIAAVERVERIYADDRFAAEAEQVAPQLRNHLTSAIETCQGLLDRIND